MDATFRTVWLSDVHLGSRACRVQLLLDFLRRTRCDTLYLVGDIIDLESLRAYKSLAQHVKTKIGGAQRYIATFRHASLQAAEVAGVDGIVCGHIHKAELVEHDGLVYCNDGDWVESCTAIVERLDGSLELKIWRSQAAVAPVSQPLRDAA